MECLAGEKRFDFSADVDHDPDTRIFKGNFYHFGIGAVVRRSAVLAEVCSFRVLQVETVKDVANKKLSYIQCVNQSIGLRE